MTKIDFKKELKHLYKASAKKVDVVDVPQMNYIMIDGTGAPDTSPTFGKAIEALYPLAYTVKFMSKLGPLAQDYVVPPLEGLWWADDMTAFVENRRQEWKWIMMIMQPDFVTQKMVNEAFETVKEKKNPELLGDVRFESYEEGESVQTLHVGPFDQEGPTVEKLHAEIDRLGKKHALKHHEIYLSDPRKSAPEKLRTILRQPVR